ncbi:MAG: hypothetical protein JRN32_02135 [Nitrososphaerota archaeon]|nr:hypothetical protein [Nitrososphaerota archaeon]
MKELRVESVYGFERILTFLVAGQFDQAFKLSGILAGELGLPNPYLSYQRYGYAKAQIYGSAPLGVKMSAMVSLHIRPTMTNTERILTYYKLQFETYNDIYSFLFDAARQIEGVFGVNITRLMTGQVLQPILVSLSAVTAPPEGISPNIFIATMLYLISILTGKEKDKSEKALRYAYLSEAYNDLAKNGSMFSRPYYQNKAFMYSIQFNAKANDARERLVPAIKELEGYASTRSVRYFYPRMATYFPFFVVDRNAWSSGTPQQSGSIALFRPEFPHTASEGKPLLVGIYSSTGSGKTTLLNSLTYYAWIHNNFILRLEVDIRDAMAAQLMALPLPPQHPAYSTLRAQELNPSAVGIENIISVLIIENKADLDLVPNNPTSVDRVLYVENLDAFHLPWERIVAPRKVFSLRSSGNTRTGIRAFRSTLESFRTWRTKNRAIPTFIGVDEAYTGASSMPSYRQARALGMSAESFTDLAMVARGLGISLYLATQRPKMIVAGARTQLSHIFAADVGEEKDIDIILSRIPKSSRDREAVEGLFARSEIRSDPYHWFVWVNLLDGSINVIRSVIAPTSMEMPGKSSWDQFHDAKLSLETWDQVPTLFGNVGTESNPLPVYEPLLPERDRKKRGYIQRPPKAEPEEDKEKGEAAAPAPPVDKGFDVVL